MSAVMLVLVLALLPASCAGEESFAEDGAAVLQAICDLNPDAPICQTWAPLFATGTRACELAQAVPLLLGQYWSTMFPEPDQSRGPINEPLIGYSVVGPYGERVSCGFLGPQSEAINILHCAWRHPDDGADTTQIYALDLSDQGITQLPSFADLKHGCSLDVSTNALKELDLSDTTLGEINANNNPPLVEYEGPASHFCRCSSEYYQQASTCTLCPCYTRTAADSELQCDEESSIVGGIVGTIVYIIGILGAAYIVWVLTDSAWSPPIKTEEIAESQSVEEASARKEKADALSDAYDTVQAIQDVAKVSRTSVNQLKIVWLQLQMCCAALLMDWNWPKLLSDFRSFMRWLIAWIQLDSALFVPIDCVAGPGSRGLNRRVAVAVFTLLGLCLVQALRKKSLKHKAHLANFLWAFYLLFSPVVWNAVVSLVHQEGGMKKPGPRPVKMYVLLGMPVIFIAVIIPSLALVPMTKLHAEGKLHSPEGEANFGWLCAHYKSKCFWWEVPGLIARLIVVALVLVSSASVSLVVFLLVTFSLLGLQLAYQPFLESAEQAAHWSSPNKQAVIGHATTLIVVFIGLLTNSAELNPDGAGAVLLSIVGIIATLTPMVMTLVMTLQDKGIISGGPITPAGDATGSANNADKDEQGEAELADEVENPVTDQGDDG